MYTRAATTVPPMASHIAFASLGPVQMLHFQGSSLQAISPPPATTLSDHIIYIWKVWWAWSLHSLVFPNNGQAAANAIHLGTAHGVCNSSYMRSEASPDFATAAWLLEDSCLLHLNLYWGITHISSRPSGINAYHVKLQGLYALVLLAIKGLCSFHSITTRSVTVGCNNLGTLHQAQQTQELTPCSSVHADLICAIHRIHCSLPSVTIHFKHVKGHQDDQASASSLPCLAQLTILANQLAKCSLLRLLQHHQCWVGMLIGDAWSLQVNNQVVTLDPHPWILWHLGYHAAYKYMGEKSSTSPLQDFH